jgi:hypothetical protein
MFRYIMLGIALISIFSLVALAQQEVKIEPPGLLMITSTSNDGNDTDCTIDEEGTYYYYPLIPSGELSFESYQDCPPAPCEGAIITGDGKIQNCE